MKEIKLIQDHYHNGALLKKDRVYKLKTAEADILIECKVAVEVVPATAPAKPETVPAGTEVESAPSN